MSMRYRNLIELVGVKPALDLLLTDVGGCRSDQLVEDDRVVLPEAELGDARHVLIQRQYATKSRLVQGAIDDSCCAMKCSGKRPRQTAKHWWRDLRGHPPQGFHHIAY